MKLAKLALVLLICLLGLSAIAGVSSATTTYINLPNPQMLKLDSANLPTYETVTDLTAPNQTGTTIQFNFDGSGQQWCGWENTFTNTAFNVGDIVTVSGYYWIPANCTELPYNITQFKLFKNDYVTVTSTVSQINYDPDGEWHYFLHKIMIKENFTNPLFFDFASFGFMTYSGYIRVNGITVNHTVGENQFSANVKAADKTVVTIGDSITYGGNTNYSQILGYRLPGWTFINKGISGDHTDDVIARWQTNVTALSPDYVIILIGVNDIGVVSAETTENRIATMCTWAKNNGTTPILCKLTPYSANAGVTTLNTWIDTYAGTNAIRVMDLYTLFNNASNAGYYQPYYSFDGIHPSDTGYVVMGELFTDNSFLSVNFSTDSTNGTAPLTVTFTPDCVGNVSEWTLNFGDGTTYEVTNGTEPFPVAHTYSTAATRNASLSITGDSLVLVKNMTITVLAAATPTPAPATTENSSFRFGLISSNMILVLFGLIGTALLALLGFFILRIVSSGDGDTSMLLPLVIIIIGVIAATMIGLKIIGGVSGL